MPSLGYQQTAWVEPANVPLSKLARKVLALATLVLAVVLSAGDSYAQPKREPTDVLGEVSKSKNKSPNRTDDASAEGQGVADRNAENVVDGVSEDDLAIYRRLTREPGGYGRVFFTLGGGKGIRFNNPFRLSEQLGEGAQSVSLTAGYVDASINATFGEPDGLQHGGSVHLSVGVEGVGQQAFSASYLALYRGRSAWMGYGRVGLSLLTAPDVNVGGELAAGVAYFLTGALGLNLELVGNLFYGAGTYDVEITTVPILSLQGGLIIDYEVLP